MKTNCETAINGFYESVLNYLNESYKVSPLDEQELIKENINTLEYLQKKHKTFVKKGDRAKAHLDPTFYGFDVSAYYVFLDVLKSIDLYYSCGKEKDRTQPLVLRNIKKWHVVSQKNVLKKIKNALVPAVVFGMIERNRCNLK